VENKSHLTAITRKKLSQPTRYLLDNNLLDGRILDFGCGKGFDTDFLTEKGFDITGYDPYFRPEKPTGQFNTIICNYVLNVLSENEANKVIDEIKSLLVHGGFAYITVRRDINKEGHTKRGTFQRIVKLNLPILKENKNFCMYFLGC
jgi:2-polyprenyl-3-methyl-5-hydroxy-6-metoxy-1,4-benzoquinol methylase